MFKLKTTVSPVINYATENAARFEILGQQENETGAGFRERVARELWKMNQQEAAKQVILNIGEEPYLLLESTFTDDNLLRRMAYLGEEKYEQTLVIQQDYQKLAKRYQWGLFIFAVICSFSVVVIIILGLHLLRLF